LIAEVGLDSVVEKLEGGAALVSAAGQRRPDALAPLAALFTAGSLGDQTVNHHKANGLFYQVVGRLDVGCGYEAEVGITMEAETLG